jgi:hypothetical protein
MVGPCHNTPLTQLVTLALPTASRKTPVHSVAVLPHGMCDNSCCASCKAPAVSRRAQEPILHAPHHICWAACPV